MSITTLQESDRLPGRRIGVVGAVSILVVVVGVAISTATLWGHSIIGARPTVDGPDQIGIVEQRPILTAHRAEDLRRAQRAELTRYRWIDETHEVAEIPIDRAISILAEKKR